MRMTKQEYDKMLAGNPDLQAPSKPTVSKKPANQFSESEIQLARQLQSKLERGELYWFVYRPILYLANEKWATQDFVSMGKNGFIYWQQSKQVDHPVQVSSFIPTDWTNAEWAFARLFLDKRIESEEYLFAIPQLPLYMPGQRFTPDFVAIRSDGGADYFEVKGAKYISRNGKKQGLMSDGRASAKIRWAASVLNHDGHTFYWARQQDDDSFKTRRISIKYPTRPILRAS